MSRLRSGPAEPEEGFEVFKETLCLVCPEFDAERPLTDANQSIDADSFTGAEKCGRSAIGTLRPSTDFRYRHGEDAFDGVSVR